MDSLITVIFYTVTTVAVVRWVLDDDTSLLIIVLLFAAAFGVFTGCESVHQSKPIRGASLDVMADGSVHLRGADNAKTPTPVDITRADGTRITAKFGTSSEPIITIKPGPPWTRIMVGAGGLIAFLAGAVLTVKGWPRIGAALALCGLLLIGIGIVAETHAWVIALGTAFIFALVIGGLYYGYRTGTQQPAPAA